MAGSDVYPGVPHRSSYDTAKVATGNGDFDDVTSTDAPDQVLYRTAPFTEPTAVAGPLVATLWATLTAPDAEFFVRVATEAPDGSLSLLNRGYLKASHRAVDRERSFVDGDVMYRPWHPHTSTTTALVIPGEPTQFDIEVWPLETIVRPGHRLVMIVSAPATQDLFDTYQPRTAPAAGHASCETPSTRPTCWSPSCRPPRTSDRRCPAHSKSPCAASTPAASLTSRPVSREMRSLLAAAVLAAALSSPAQAIVRRVRRRLQRRAADGHRLPGRPARPRAASSTWVTAPATSRGSSTSRAS